jgi:aquaporin Z
MGITALLIFYSPFTKHSGSHINPAVTLCFLRIKKIKVYDALFYIIFQVFGGTSAVYLMSWTLKDRLTAPPINYVATVPFKGILAAFITEFVIAFVMITMVLFTSSHYKWKKYTKVLSGLFVCVFVILAAPMSGFGMNPARSLASAIPSNTWTAFWIYAIVPIISMQLATELFLRIEKEGFCVEIKGY